MNTLEVLKRKIKAHFKAHLDLSKPWVVLGEQLRWMERKAPIVIMVTSKAPKGYIPYDTLYGVFDLPICSKHKEPVIHTERIIFVDENLRVLEEIRGSYTKGIPLKYVMNMISKLRS